MNELSENLPAQMRQMLEAFRSDNRSGAAELLRKAAAAYQAAASIESREPALTLDYRIEMAGCISSVLSEAQPDMAGVLNMIREVKGALDRAGSPRPLELAASAASEFAESASKKTAASAARGAQLIAENAVVLTHSRSSTVLGALLNAARDGRRFSLIATESRPMLEGRGLAEAMTSAGVAATIIVDAAAGLVMDTVDLVLVGADRVTPSHVLNKIGTGMIALAARQAGIPVYCLADTSKFIGLLQTIRRRSDLPDAEVWPDHPAGISIMNRYFEEVPIELFTAIVTESGPLEPTEAARVAERGVGSEE
jgi:translation initiation factor eIF-2B subunit delta